MSMFGFGHALPVDDLLTGNFGTIDINKYELVAPDNSRFDLGLPDLKSTAIQQSPSGMAVDSGDLGLRRISCTDKSIKGTYQVVARSKPIFFTSYLDTNGKQRMAPTSMDAIKDLKTVLMSMKYETFAKSFYALGEWTEPKPQGYDLEIMPLNDLSNVRVGDLVRFKVTFKGTPVNISEKAINRMTCVSNTFGGPDKFQLDSYLVDGIAQFRLPTAGQWVANVYFKQEVAGDPSLADLKGKCTLVYTAGTVSFTVKP